MIRDHLAALAAEAQGFHRIAARVRSLTALRFLRALVRESQEDDISGMAAEMAYRFLFAIFPMVLFLAASLGFIGDAVGLDSLFARLLCQVAPLLPGPVRQVLETYTASLFATQSSAFLTVGLLGSVWGTTGGVATLIKGLNRAYDVQRPRPFWRRQALALASTLTLVPSSLALVVFVILGRQAVIWLSDATRLGPALAGSVSLARWPVLMLGLLGVFSLMYHVLPNTQHRYWWSLPGSAVAAVGWLSLTQGFGVYLSHLTDFGLTYGGFGAVIAFLLWLYLVGVTVLVGAEVNALLEPSRRAEWLSPDQAQSPTGAVTRDHRFTLILGAGESARSAPASHERRPRPEDTAPTR